MFNVDLVNVFALRHGKPLKNGEVDPGLDLSSSDEQVRRAAEKIAQLMTRSGAITVYTSPARRAVETGRMLLDGRLPGTYQREPNIESGLDERTIMSMPPTERSSRWYSMLFTMAEDVRRRPSVLGNPAIVLVTHEPALYTIPQLPPNKVDSDYGAVNHFQI